MSIWEGVIQNKKVKYGGIYREVSQLVEDERADRGGEIWWLPVRRTEGERLYEGEVVAESNSVNRVKDIEQI